MGNSLRCCLACVIPCGALDLIRIVHLNGHVEEITHPITAGEVIANNPNHVLSMPTASSQGNVVRRILILSPESELKRGNIYFLIPETSVPEKKKRRRKKDNNNDGKSNVNNGSEKCGEKLAPAAEVVDDVAAGKRSRRRRSRRSGGGAGEWRPHLDSIFED